MIIYSKKIIQFVHDIKKTIKEILSNEIHLRVFGDRFFDKTQKFSYPISVVIYNNKSMLGYFDAEFYELGFHECWMYANKAQLQNIIRHELAHYMTFINHGHIETPHGDEFKTFCLRMGWDEEVYKSTMCIGDIQNLSEIEESSIFRKIKKLMALATSNNQNEAEQAMIKSQQLLLKHNIESKYIEGDDEEKIVLKRIIKEKRQNTKLRSIAKILETFFVNVVFRGGRGFIHLEILGSPVNVEIAEYVANILNHELDDLWTLVKKQHTSLKGQIAKNSFFQGIAKGYCNKINALKKEYDGDILQSLLVIEKKLVDGAAMAYPRLSSSKSYTGHCQTSSALGEKIGRALNINPPINNSSKNSEPLITYK